MSAVEAAAGKAQAMVRDSVKTVIAASMVGTATRMMSQPACSSFKIWATVAAASSVFVLHID